MIDLFFSWPGGLIEGGAIVWLFKKGIQKWKGKVEVKLDDLSDAAKKKLGL